MLVQQWTKLTCPAFMGLTFKGVRWGRHTSDELRTLEGEGGEVTILNKQAESPGKVAFQQSPEGCEVGSSEERAEVLWAGDNRYEGPSQRCAW